MPRSEHYILNEQTGMFSLQRHPGAPLFAFLLALSAHIALAAGIFLFSSSGQMETSISPTEEITFFVETVLAPPPEPEVQQETVKTIEPEPQAVREDPMDILPFPSQEENVLNLPAPVPPPLKTKPSPKQVVPRIPALSPPVRPKPPRRTRQFSATKPVFSAPQAKSVRAQALKIATSIAKPSYPAYLQNPPPSYPKKARRKHQQGIVELRVLISARGHVEKISLFKSSGFALLDKSALQTVRTWRFLPAKQMGRAVAGEVIVPVRFHLTGESG